MFTPGEINVTGYQSYLGVNRTTGVVAQEIGAGTIVLEHRYWGMSSPFAELTTENMRYLTLEQAIKDLTYFAENVKLPFDQYQTSAPSKAPWVMMYALTIHPCRTRISANQYTGAAHTQEP